MLLPLRKVVVRRLEKRGISSQTMMMVIIVVAVIFILTVTYVTTIKFRVYQTTSKKAKQAPNEKMPSLFSWLDFRKRPKRTEYSTTSQDTEYQGGGDGSRLESREMSGAASADPERQDGTQTRMAGGVDRNTSVRSVMTLPAYSMSARENERILGREGERGGIDNVVELPETLDEEETAREQEMESLYQIRLARRVEAADREARRQARRDARARGDVQAHADIRRRAEEAADLSVSQLLIAEHQSRTKTRERKVSSVAYGDLGVARHDGTRLRANSTESDTRPLLDSAASISGQSHRSRAYTNNTLNSELNVHSRNLSITSVSQTVHSHASSDYDFAEPSRTNSHSYGNSDDFEIVSLDPESGDGSGNRSQAHTLGAETPAEDAPAYEHPPGYESPSQTRAPQLPVLERLPSIHVTKDSSSAPSYPR